MREILFRGRRTESEKWVEGGLIIYSDGDCFIARQSDNPNVVVQCSIDASTVGQYTGLKDKNGKRIFEGDIVRYPDSDTYNSWNDDINEGVVDWDEDVMCFYFTNRWVIDMTDFDIENGRMTEVEVIGNIHDNQEMLGGGGDE